jgi:hypothetical protein
VHVACMHAGWLSCPDGTHEPVGPNWLIIIPTGTVPSLDTREIHEHELKIECTPTGPPVHHIMAGDSPAEFRAQ